MNSRFPLFISWMLLGLLSMGGSVVAEDAAGRGVEVGLKPGEAFDDVDVLVRMLAGGHPNLYFHATPQQLATLRAKAEGNFTHAVTAEEFFTAVDPLVRAVGE